MPSPPALRFERQVFPALCVGAIAAAVLLALLAGDRLVGLEMDDPWYMWFAWRLAHGFNTDPLFGAVSTQIFGRAWVWLLAKAYAAGGWRLAAGHLVSLFCIVAAAAIWFHLGRRLAFSRAQAALLAALLVVYHPFLRAGLSARPEAFIWLLTGFALLSLDAGYPFVAGLIAGLAAETHPMGLIVCCYLAAWSLRMRESRAAVFRDGLYVFAALVVSLPVYLGLHGAYLLPLLHDPHGASLAAMTSFRTPVLAYLESGDLLRRVAGLSLLALSVVAYAVSGCWRREKLPLYLAAAMLVLFLLVPRANPLYFLYFVPVMLIALTASLTRPGWLMATLAAICIPCLVNYCWIVQSNRAFSQVGLEQRLHAELKGSDLPVLTNSVFWPALRCQSNMRSIQDFPEQVASGMPFYLLLQRGQDLTINFPRDTVVQHIHISPRADFFLYRVHPSAKDLVSDGSYPDCPER